MPLGAYRPVISDLDELKACIEDAGGAELPFQLTVENGPTVQGGNIRTLRSFFDNCAIQGIPVRMTFDIGNWSWCGENVFEAAEALTEFVVYLHCKQVNDRFKRTGPLTHDPEAAWRQVLARFPKELPRGGEFPIVGDDLEISTKQYVRELSIQS
jgi:sugar phosphate isomerase/epimerase